MNRRLTCAITLASLAALSAGCAQQDQNAGDTETRQSSAEVSQTALGTATVEAPGGTQIPESVFRYYSLNALQKPIEELTPEEREAVLDNLAAMQLLAEEAQSRGLPSERTIAVQLELQRQQVLAQNVLRRFADENPPTEAEIQAEYDSVIAQSGSVEHHASHILVETREEAEAIIDQLQDGADFAELAQEHSIDPGSSNGGDLGWFSSDAMVAPFSEAVEQMEVGSFSSEPVETQFGWHVILVDDRREVEPPALDTVRQDVSNRVTQRKVEEFIESLSSARE